MMHEEKSKHASLNKVVYLMMVRRCQGCEIMGGSGKQELGEVNNCVRWRKEDSEGSKSN